MCYLTGVQCGFVPGNPITWELIRNVNSRVTPQICLHSSSVGCVSLPLVLWVWFPLVKTHAVSGIFPLFKLSKLVIIFLQPYQHFLILLNMLAC